MENLGSMYNTTVEASKWCANNPSDCASTAAKNGATAATVGGMGMASFFAGVVSANFIKDAALETYTALENVSRGEFTAAANNTASALFNAALGTGFAWLTYTGVKGTIDHEASTAAVKADAAAAFNATSNFATAQYDAAATSVSNGYNAASTSVSNGYNAASTSVSNGYNAAVGTVGSFFATADVEPKGK